MTNFLPVGKKLILPAENFLPVGNGSARLAIELDGGAHAQIDQMRRDAAQKDYLRTLGIRWLRIPNAMVLEHPDEFVWKVVGTMRAVAEKERK